MTDIDMTEGGLSPEAVSVLSDVRNRTYGMGFGLNTGAITTPSSAKPMVELEVKGFIRYVKLDGARSVRCWAVTTDISVQSGFVACKGFGFGYPGWRELRQQAIDGMMDDDPPKPLRKR